MRRFSPEVVLLVAAVVLAPLQAKEAEKPKPPPRPPAVAKSDYGGVSGQVYDAVSKLPIKGAEVFAQDILEFPTKGKTTGQSDERGRYKVQARLGRTSWKMEWGKAILGALLGFGGAGSEETKRIDVCQLNLRVKKDGYKSFEGPVPVRWADAIEFRVVLEPVLLVPKTAEELSGVAVGWGVIGIRAVAVDPPVLQPGREGKVKVLLAGPRELLVKAKKGKLEPAVRVVCKSGPPFWLEKKRPKGLWSNFALTKVEEGEEGVAYAGTFKIDRKSKARDEVVVAEILESPFDVVRDGGSAEGILQVACTREEEELAGLRVAAHEASLSGDNAAAAEKMKQACEMSGAGYADFRRLAAYAEAVHDYATAAEAMGRALRAQPKDKQVKLAGEYGRLLIEAGRLEEVVKSVASMVEEVPKKSRVERIPMDAVVGIGLAHLRLGNLEKAEQVSKDLAEWSKVAAPTALSAEFRRELRLAKAESEVKARPDDPQALAAYGRTLMDFGRWDEAIRYLMRALELKPDMTDLYWDLHHARVRMGATSEMPVENLEEALKAAEAAVAPQGPDKPKTKDFFAWHRLALLLYRKACMERAAGAATAEETFGRARDCLIEAIRCAREGQVIQETALDTLVAITGYAFEEANYDYVMMDALDHLAVNPEDRLANFNLAWALCGLKQYDLAAPVVEQCLRLWPDFPGVKHLAAQVALQKGDREAAVKNLQEVVQANPWHPDASVLLAEIYTETGDMASAAASLATHAAWYGAWRRPVSAW